MKPLTFSLLALLLVSVATFGVYRLTRHTATDAPSAGSGQSKLVAKKPAAQSTQPAGAPLALNPSQPPLSRVEPAPAPVVPGLGNIPNTTLVSSESAFIEGARVLAERSSQPNAEGRVEKTRLLEIPSAKYPFVRSEEVWLRDAKTGEEKLDRRTMMVADHFLVKLMDGTSATDLQDFVSAFGGNVRRQIGKTGTYLVSTPAVSLEDYETTRAQLSVANSPALRVEPDYVVHALFAPNDPDYSKLWGLNNISQTGGTGDADIDAPEAWDVTRGNVSVIVGVIDTGIDYNHPDLAANIWRNPGEIPANGIDDDNNGYIDDVYGWDFVNNDANPMDDHYHGTHCAGTIGGVGDNGIGVIGVSPSVKMMALKFLSSSGGGYISDAVEAVTYATANGARITSNSWGGGGYSQTLKDAIDQAAAAGVLFVAAAGNSSSNNDYLSHFPSSYLSPSVIAVAATDHNDQLASFSSYGLSSVHLSAPGVNIYSTAPNNTYRYLSGTSMATPHVAGAAALLLSTRPDWHWAEVKDSLLKNVDQITALRGKVSTGGRLNIGRSLILNSGPYVSLISVGAFDSAPAGGVGNGDGIISPGEDIALRIYVQNSGSAAAAGVVTTASIAKGGNAVSLLRNTSSLGTLAPGQLETNAALPLLVRVSSSASSPQIFTVRFVTTTTTGLSWSSEASFSISRVSTIQGRVLRLTGANPISGALITAKGTGVSAQTVTTASGTYELTVLDGTYSIEASAAGYTTAPAVSLTVPPSFTSLDFSLGSSLLQISPTAIISTQQENTVTTHTLTLTNSGDQALTLTISGSGVATAASSDGVLSQDPLAALGQTGGTDNPTDDTPVGVLGTVSPLPIDDDFEDGVLDGWDTGTGIGDRQIVTGVSANGSRSFRFRNTDGNAHYNGLQRDLAAGSQPAYISFWVRAGATTEASGYFTLNDGNGDTVIFYAKENGRLYINGDTNGDNSYTYSAGVWYHIELRAINWTTRRFDYYVNGSLVKSSIPLRRASADIRRVSLYNFSAGSEAWWDDVRLFDHSAGWLAYTPRAMTLAPGQSSPVTVTLDSTDLVAGVYQGRLEFISNDSVKPRTSVPITLTVQAVPNTPPTATSQTVTFNEDTPAVITLAGIDPEGAQLTAIINSLPATGTLYQTSDGTTLGTAITQVPVAVTNAEQRVIYVPVANANGAPLASFTFTVMDRRNVSTTATVTLNATPVNDIPQASSDIANATPSSVIESINVLGNDTDADGDTLTTLSFTQGARGTVTANPDGTFRYVPAASFTDGSDVFHYTISDGNGGTATGRVNIILGYLAGGNWPTMGGNVARTGYYPANFGSGTLIKSWSLPYGRPLNQVAMVEGRVFVTPSSSGDAYISAVRLSTGTEEWRRTLLTANTTSGPSYHKGTLYFQRANHTSDSQLWAVDAVTGATKWSGVYSTQFSTYQPPAVTDLSVYSGGGYTNGLYGFNRTSGAQLFMVGLPQETGWTPTINDGVPYTFVRGILTAHNPATGAAAWTTNVKPDTSTYSGGTNTVTIANNRAYFVNKPATGAELICVDLATHLPVWRIPATYFQFAPAVANGVVYVIDSNSIRAYNADTGAVVANYATGVEHAQYQPIVTNDTLIAANINRVWIWDLATTNVRQTFMPGGIVSLSDGNLLVAGSAGSLDCYGVSATNRTPPVATAKTVTGVEDQLVSITLSGTDADNDVLSAVVTTLPPFGTLYQTDDGINPAAPILTVPTIVTHPEMKVVYRPLADDSGSARVTFSFRVADIAFNSAAALVTINLTPVNDAPVASDDTYRLRPGHVLTAFNPVANDIDVDGDVLTVPSFTTPARGTLIRNPDDTFKYTPAEDFTSGADTFNYTLRDPSGTTSTATVTIEVSSTIRSDWPTLGGAATHAGYYSGELGVTPFTELWRYTVSETVNAPSVADGRVYLTTLGNTAGYSYAIALDVNTGSESWRTRFPPAYSLNQPSWFSGKIYIQQGNGDNGLLHAMDASTGASVWQRPFNSTQVRHFAAAVDESGVYIQGGYTVGLYGFSHPEGVQKFFVSLPAITGWAAMLGDNNVYSYLGGVFQAHSRTTGASLWSLTLGSANLAAMNRSVAYADGIAYLAHTPTGTSELIAIDVARRSVKWRTPVVCTGTPTIANGIVYVAASGRVLAFNAGSGRLVREYVAPGEYTNLKPPIVTHDVLVVSSTSKTYFFNLATLAVIQTVNVGSEIAVADDSIIVSGTDKIVRRFGRIPSINHAPTAAPLNLDIREEATVSIQFAGTDVDGDQLSYVIRTLPAKGSLYQTADGATKGELITTAPALVRNPGGTLIYEAPLDLAGSAAETFTYTANDYATTSAAAVVTINITPVNDAPVAMPDTVSIRPNEILTNFVPQFNDTDPDDDVLTIASFTQPANGVVAVSADGSLQYTPATGFVEGDDSFDYTISDPSGLTSTAKVSIIVSAGRGREWTMFGGGPDHTGYQPVKLAGLPFAERWTNNIGYNITHPTIAAGRVYVGQIYSNVSKMMALDVGTGSELWRIDYSGGSMRQPAYYNGNLFHQGGSAFGYVYAVRADTGASVWTSSFSTQASAYLAPTVDSTGVYINGGSYGGTYKFNPTTGAQVFFVTLEQLNNWTPLRHQGGLYTFVSGRVRRHNPDTGAILGTLDLTTASSGSMDRTIAAENGVGYLVNYALTAPAGGRDLVAVELATLTTKWSVRDTTFNGTPAVANGVVYALVNGGVKAYSASNGRLLRTFITPGETFLQAQPIVTNDTVIAYSMTKTYVFDILTGNLRQTIPYGGRVSLAGPNLYIANGSDQLLRSFGVPDALNNPPSAQPVEITINEDTPIAITLAATDADGDTLRCAITRLPTKGALYYTTDGVTPGARITAVPALVGTAPTRVIYIPPQDTSGTGIGNFGFAASDSSSSSTEAAVTINVNPINDAPVAENDFRVIQPGQILSPVRERANDFDADGDALTIVAFTQPSAGTVALNGDGSLRYESPKTATIGRYTFSYTVADPVGAQSTATVTIDIVSTITGLWPTQGGGGTRSGYAPVTLGDTAYSVRWSRNIGTALSPVAVGDGLVFATARTADGSVFLALDERSGVPKWQRTFAASHSLNPPTYDRGLVYVQRINGTSDSQLLSLSSSNGTTFWSAPFTSQWAGYLAPLVLDDGVFVGGGNFGGLYGFQRTTGTQSFYRQLLQMDQWAPAASSAGELFSFIGGGIIQHDKTTGAANWSVNTGWGGFGSSMNRTIAITDRIAIVIADSPTPEYSDEDLVAIDLDTHQVTWSINGEFTGTPSIAQGIVYAISGSTVQARSASTGYLIGTYSNNRNDGLVGQPVVTEDLVIVASSQRTYLFSRQDRRLIQALPTGGSVSVADDQILVADPYTGVLTVYATQPAISFTPAGGNFTEPVLITLGAREPGARIYYTLDGTAPDFASPWVSSGASVLMKWTGKVRAIMVSGSGVSRINEVSVTLLDSDIDGIPDWWETARFGGTGVTAAGVDTDGDGLTDRDEFLAGTDPFDSHDALAVSNTRLGAGDGIAALDTDASSLVISWPSKSDRYYIVEATADLKTWTASSDPIVGTDGTLSHAHPLAGSSRVFLRVRVLPLLIESVP